MDDLFDAAEAARRLHKKPGWLEAHRHDVPFIRVGRSRMYTQELLDRYLARQTVDTYGLSARSKAKRR